MTFKLRTLPYPEHALEPVIGRQTVSVHYHKHHGGYVSKLNDAIEEKGLPNRKLIEVIRNADDDKLFNVAAQVWNHDFYWDSMTPDDTRPDTAVAKEIDRTFGSLAGFEEQFKEAALNEFGSGWTWLGWDGADDRLRVESTTDAVIPLSGSFTPLLTLDVWEHAYYLDYQNDRAAYIEGFLSKLINWDAVARRLVNARREDAVAAGA
jgi:Fe-Mn family superoxide dismutase